MKEVMKIAILGIALLSAGAVGAEPVLVLHAGAQAGEANTVLVAPCIKVTSSVPGVAVVTQASGREHALTYTPPANAAQTVTIDAVTGEAPAEANGDCLASTPVRAVITTKAGPEISDAALKEAFNLLVGAFVLALLMESAFALLFNWRIFQEFLVGRAWRTIIMFTVSLLVVTQFKLDLLASLITAYHGTSAPKVDGNWLTRVLTAMIIAGGSAGVNRILVALGFRSQLPKVEQEKSELVRRNLAYISVTVDSRVLGNQNIIINALEVPCDGTATMLGAVYRQKRARLRGLLFGEPGRFPRSGGYALDASHCYRLSVTIVGVNVNRLVDMNGVAINQPANAPVYRFAPGAIVDFVIP